MKDRLNKIFPGQVEMITGSYPAKDSDENQVQKRIAIAKKYNQGKIKVLVSTTQTMGEPVSLISEDRPNYILFAQPPVVPAGFDQNIGRVYRIGQKAPVGVIEMVPESDLLAQ